MMNSLKDLQHNCHPIQW